ncbi:NAD(P)-binding domain-containing protein [Hyphomicrobium sp. CS1GBMeth3]|uniref:NADPH-dependent F420 reductase n=1 Tax=Hyphomicrobium sp. CS1GBMeth3 TaxID=1892845 RepID=UPI0009FB2556|nr:NAD(P)-binding domain-containing protein [Hyphomicrobium sp. CS1GBMeth3]
MIMTVQSALYSRRRVLQLTAATGLATSALVRTTSVMAQTASAPLKIATIGAGNLGAAVGTLWVKAGHEVLFSSRNPDNLKGLVDGLGAKARAGTVDEAIAFGDAILLAVPYEAYPQVGADYAEKLKGKVVLDAGNANRSSLFAETQENGVGVTTAKYFPGVRIVRAFNAANHRLFTSNANRPAPRMAVPIAGDDAEALEIAKTLVSSAGFDPLVVGSLKDADKFAMGTEGFGHVLPAVELAAKLGVLAPANL